VATFMYTKLKIKSTYTELLSLNQQHLVLSIRFKTVQSRTFPAWKWNFNHTNSWYWSYAIN